MSKIDTDTTPRIKAKPVIPKNVDVENEITVCPNASRQEKSKTEDVQPIVLSDESTGIFIREYEYVIEGDETLVPIPKNCATYLSNAMNEVPSIANSVKNQKILGRTAYSITLEGKDVLPEQLFKKKSGSLISNLKGKNHPLGKQADINPIDFSNASAVNLGSAIFSVASVATSTYYLKNINDNLDDLKKTVKSVYDFLNRNQQTKIESYLEDLEEIANNLEEMADNEVYRDVAVQKLTTINMETAGFIKSYERSIADAIKAYAEGSKKTKKKEYENLQERFYYYTLCQEALTLTELLIAQIADKFDEKNLNRVAASAA